MTTDEQLETVKAKIVELQSVHRSLDRLIAAAADDPRHDDLQLRRLKKQKLLLKDQICILERQLVPDIRA